MGYAVFASRDHYCKARRRAVQLVRNLNSP